MIGCQGELCPFDGEVSFSRRAAAVGAVLFSTTGGDNQLWQVTVVRVAFYLADHRSGRP